MPNKRHRLLALLAVCFTVSLCPAGRAAAQVPDPVNSPNSWMNVTPGANPSQLDFSWATANMDLSTFDWVPMDDILSSAPSTYQLPVPEVQIIKLRANEDPDSLNFATDARTQTFDGLSLESYVTQSGVTSFAGWYQNKVTVTGLANSSIYAYRVGGYVLDNGPATAAPAWSGIYTIKTANPDAFTFVAVGDPQLGASSSGSDEPPEQVNNILPYDTAAWANSVDYITSAKPAFIVSLGDQIDNTSTQAGADPQYDAYFGPVQLLGIPVATVDGNHDYGLGQYYAYHYNQPHQSAQYGATQYGNDGDYWFRYGSALFMMLNSNTISAATHDVFIGKALAANPDATWTIVCFHHSLFSVADHAFDTDVLFRRGAYSAIFDKYHIDVVFSGHDHSFTRTYQLLGGQPVSVSAMRTAKNGSVSVVRPEGTLYMTLDSGSGSKFYDLNSAYTPTSLPIFVAKFWQQYLPTYSTITVNPSQFSIVTYSLGYPYTDQVGAIDSYTITK